jgi:hypothetical protein
MTADLPADVRYAAACAAVGEFHDHRKQFGGPSWERIVDAVAAVILSALQGGVLERAADLLDRQASAHNESVVDYTDLLRVWAADNERWEQGR